MFLLLIKVVTMDEVDCLDTTQVAEIIMVCNGNGTATTRGYISRGQRLRVILGTYLDQAVERQTYEIPDRVASRWICSSVVGVADSYLVEESRKIGECSP